MIFVSINFLPFVIFPIMELEAFVMEILKLKIAAKMFLKKQYSDWSIRQVLGSVNGKDHSKKTYSYKMRRYFTDLK